MYIYDEFNVVANSTRHVTLEERAQLSVAVVAAIRNWQQVTAHVLFVRAPVRRHEVARPTRVSVHKMTRKITQGDRGAHPISTV